MREVRIDGRALFDVRIPSQREALGRWSRWYETLDSDPARLQLPTSLGSEAALTGTNAALSSRTAGAPDARSTQAGSRFAPRWVRRTRRARERPLRRPGCIEAPQARGSLAPLAVCSRAPLGVASLRSEGLERTHRLAPPNDHSLGPLQFDISPRVHRHNPVHSPQRQPSRRQHSFQTVRFQWCRFSN